MNETAAPPPRPGRPSARWIAASLALGAVASGLAQQLLVTVYVVDGVSMEPTLAPGQRLLVWRPCGDLTRGDLVVFRNPIEPDEVMVKRILGLPSERVEVAAERLFVGGFEIGEPYVKVGTRTGALEPQTVFEGHYFLLGDNRTESVDSRRLGPIPRRLVVGKVIWPAVR